MDVNSTQFIRKCVLAVSAFLFLSTLTFGQVVLGTEDFDGGGIGFTPTVNFNDGGNDHFSDTDGSDISNVSGDYSFNDGTNIFWAAEDTDDDGGNTVDEQRVTFNDVNIVGYEDITVCIDVAAGNNNGLGANAYDQPDFLFVQYNTDIQPLYIDGLGYRYFNNGDDFNEPLHHDVNINGDGSDGPQITTTAQNFCFTIPNAQTTGVSATIMSVRILVSMDSQSEEVAFDNIVITGTLQSAAVTFTAPADLCQNAGIQTGLSGGLPTGGFYVGAGVTDDGNGSTYSFDPAFGGIGPFTITYIVPGTGSASDDVTIIQPPNVVLTLAPDTFCEDAAVQNYIAAGTPVGGVYSGTGVTNSGNGATFTFDPSMAVIGTNTVTYTFFEPSSGCSNTATDDVSVLPIPDVSGLVTDVSCGVATMDGAIDITVTGAGTYTYNWMTADGAGLVNGMQDQTGLSAGTYDLTVTDGSALSCTDISSYTLVAGVMPAAPTVTDLEVCDGESTLIVPMSASGGGGIMTLYEENFDEEFAGIAGNCPDMIPANCTTFNPPSNGQWSVTGDPSGLTATSDFFNVFGGVLNAQDTDTEVCFLSSPINIAGLSMVELSVDMMERGTHEATDFVDITYIVDGAPTTVPNWMGLGDATHTLIDDFMMTTVTASGFTGTTLEVQICVMNNAGSEDIDIDNVLVTGIAGPVPMFKFYDADPAVPGATLLGGPAVSYDSGTTTADSPETIFVTECGASCDSDAASLTVTVNTLPQLILAVTNADCVGGATGAIDITATGNGGFTYMWMTSDGAGLIPTDEDQTGLSAGTYDVVVTDANMCMAMGSEMVIDGINDAPPMIACPVDITIQCGASIDLADTGNPTATDVCDPSPSVTFMDSFVASCSPNAGTLSRTFTAMDAAGNTASCTQEITIEDTTGPTFTVPGAVTIGCTDDPLDLTLTGDVTDASDACDAITPVNIWINEFHYDNAGTDVGEFVEIAGTAGTNLAGYELYLYNGGNDMVYFDFTLSGIIPDESNGIGAISFTINGLQNGSPDGLALTMGGVLVQFLSYEGVITALDGPAMGQTSMDVGFAETGSTPVGQSIQLSGTGREYADFAWGGPAADSPGTLNLNQIISPLPPALVPTVTFNDVPNLTGCGGSGTIERTWTATDACGNPTNQIQIITVVDAVAPIALCADITVELDENGMFVLDPAALDGGSSDACGTLSFSASQTIFTCADLGPAGTPGCSNTIVVTLTVMDDCGNMATCDANVTVEDNLAPVLTCPASRIINLDPGACEQVISFIPPFAEDNCGMMMATTFLGTTFLDNNGFAGNMFDIENIGTGPITINSFDVHLETAAGTAHTVGAWFVTGGGSFVGNETNAAAWTLMGDVPVISAGPGNPSALAAGGLTIQPGETYGIHIFQTDGGSNIDYTDGANTYTDSNIELTAGLGRGTPIWTGGIFTPRTWNGNVHYSFTTGNAVTVTQTAGPNLTSGDSFPRGVHTFEYEAEDGCGNISTCSFTFEVIEFPNATTSLVCNQAGVQLSIGPNCEAVVGADDILEGGPYGCYDDYIVELFFDANMFQPVPTSPVVTCANIGQTLYANVLDPDSGNRCWGTVTVLDKLAPSLECEDEDVVCTTDLTPAVGNTIDFPLPATAIVFQTGAQTGTQNYTVTNWDCCGSVILSYYDAFNDIDCLADPTNPYTKIITRTWTATDASNNSSSCSELINLIKVTLADLVYPSNYDDQDEPSLACEDREPAPASNFCGPVMGWNVIDAGDPVPVNLGELPNVIGHPSPLDELYPCGNVKWYGTGVPTGASCGNINYVFEDIRINSCLTGASDGCYKLVRNWTILDWCTGELTTHQQIIKVADQEGPMITDLVDVTISTDVWACSATYYVPQPWIMDNCSDVSGDYTVVSSNGTVDYLPSLDRYVITGMIPYNTHQVTVRAQDCCGNFTNLIYNVTVADLVPPTVVCETLHTTSLNIDGTAKVFASTWDDGSHDACNPVYFKAIRMDDLRNTQHGSNVNQNDVDCDDLNGDDNEFRFGNQIYFDDFVRFCCEDIGRDDLMVVFRVFDVNPGDGPVNPARMGPNGDLEGHFNDCMVTITVDDKLPPVIEAPTNITVSCDYWFDMENLDDPLDETFGKVVTARYNDPLVVRDSIIIYDRWCDGDANNPFGMGNAQYDPFNPTQTYRKAVGIDGLATDNCGVDININVVDNLECGQGTISRIFTATDPGGRTDSDIQRITIVDCDPYFINDTNCFNFDPFDGVRWPCDFNSQTCGQGTDPSTTGEPQIFNDDNCALIVVTHIDEDFPIVPDACFKIKRIWRVTDWCQFDENDSDNNDVYDVTDDGFVAGRWEYVQYIKVLNSNAPDVTDLDYDNCSYNTDCTGDPIFSVTIDDDCTPEDLLIVDFKLDLDNNGQYDIIGSNVFPYPYPNPNSLPILPVNYIDNGDGTYTANVQVNDLPLETDHRILWSAEDVCSNVGTLNEVIRIEDCKLPTPKLLNGLVIETMPVGCMIDVPAMMFDAGSFDNCGIQQLLIVSESQGPGQTAPPASASAVHTFDMFDIGNNTVDIWVQDVNGNWAYATTFLVLQDNTSGCDPNNTDAAISGNLNSEAGQAAADVDVNLMGSGNLINSTISNSDGAYIMNAAIGGNYTVVPEKLDEIREGLSTLDLILISQHLIGIQPLNSPYKIIAADVNNDQSITTFDLADLQRVILYIYDEFPNNKSFRFFDNNITFGSNPWANGGILINAAEHAEINGLLSDGAVIDFTAVKTGDVNGSAQMNANAPASNRSYTGEFFFNVADQALVAGETCTVDFTANEFTNLLGYQFTLGFDQAAVEFVDVAAGELDGLTASNFGTSLLSNGVMTANYGNVKATSVENGTVVFSLTLTAKTNAKLSDVLNIDRTRYTRAEAYQANLDHMDVNIQFTEGETVTVASTDFALLQNQPNPFKDVTEVSFVLPQAAAATLTIYDVSGKMLMVIEGDYAKGYNKETINIADLGATGVLYYQLDTDEFSATKKMIVID